MVYDAINMSEFNGFTQVEVIHEPEYKSLGAKTFYAVYEDQDVVVKMADSNLSREANILQSIDSNHIPKVIKHIADDPNSHLLILERLPGESLVNRIGLTEDWHSTPVTANEAVRIVDGLADCFQELIKSGYLYRDLNLGHILVADSISLVDHEWNVLINDAGNAIVDAPAGTWETMAPEEFVVGQTMTESSNVYTCGAVLLQLLTGRNHLHILKADIPDEGARRQATLDRINRHENIEMSNERLATFISTALHPDPNNRHQSIEQFKKDLHKL